MTRKMERKRYEKRWEEGSRNKEKERTGDKSYPCASGSSIFILYPFLFQNISWCLTGHPAPSPRLVGAPAESRVQTTSKAEPLHWSAPASPAGYSASDPGKSPPGRLHFMPQGWELWRTSGQRTEGWGTTGLPPGVAEGGLLLLFVLQCHMTHSVHWFPGQPIRESGLQGSMGWGQGSASKDTLWHTAMPSSLPTPWGAAIAPPSNHPWGPRPSIQTVPQTT